MAYIYHCSTWEILDTMDQYGGNFIQQLARLYRTADAENQQKLAITFQDYFIKYDEMAQIRQKK